MTFDEAMATLATHCCGWDGLPDQLDSDADLDIPGVREACAVIADWTARQAVTYDHDHR